jgi:uncharacterized membrane protein SirB2
MEGAEMDYLAIKSLHVSCVVLSISLFLLRGVLQLRGVAWRRSAVLRIAPHLIDSGLLAAAIWLALSSHQYPFAQTWLTAKLLALLAYIGCGKIALAAKTPAHRRLPAFLAAILCVIYIVGVALTRSASWQLL